MNRFGKVVQYISTYIFLFCLPLFVQASVSITEIQFNPEGSDGGYEWVEVLNSGNHINLDGWKFREANVNHKLTLPEGVDFDFFVSSGSYFVIVDNVEKFIEQYPDYQGQYFDSSFSLSNTGEELFILDDNLNQEFGINYSAQWVADYPEGSSISILDGSWVAGEPSPGGINVATSIEAETEENNNDRSTQNDSDQQNAPEIKKQEPSYISLNSNFNGAAEIRADAGGDRTVIAGAESAYKGEAFGLLGVRLRNTEFYWNFGDGSTAKKNPAKHSYTYPGEYLGFLSVQSSSYSGRDWFTVNVIQSPLSLTYTPSDEFISLKNDSEYRIEISNYYLQIAELRFNFPEGSFIEKYSVLKFELKKLGMLKKSLDPPTIASLHYPNGDLVFSYEIPAAQQTPASSSASLILEKINTESKLLLDSKDSINNAATVTQTQNPKEQTPDLATAALIVPIADTPAEEPLPADTQSAQLVLGSPEQPPNYMFILGGILLLLLSSVLFLWPKKKNKINEQADKINTDDFDIL